MNSLKVFSSLLLLCLSILLSGCGVAVLDASLIPGASGFQVQNSSEYPGVFLLTSNRGGICTAELISEDTIITAAHCLNSTDRNYIVMTDNGKEYIKQIFLMNANPEAGDADDVAIATTHSPIIEPGQSKIIIDIGDTINQGDRVTMVGFGALYNNGRGVGTKRAGSNAVNKVTNEFIDFLSPMEFMQPGRSIGGDSYRSRTEKGDSGGACIDSSGKMVGLVHAGGQSGSYIISKFINLARNQAVRSFIRQINRNYKLGIRNF